MPEMYALTRQAGLFVAKRKCPNLPNLVSKLTSVENHNYMRTSGISLTQSKAGHLTVCKKLVLTSKVQKYGTSILGTAPIRYILRLLDCISLLPIQGCGSGFAWIRINSSCWIRIWIQEGKNDPQK